MATLEVASLLKMRVTNSSLKRVVNYAANLPILCAAPPKSLMQLVVSLL